MSGFYYTESGYPTFGAAASSASERTELQNIQAGFDKFPTPTGFPNAIVKAKADQSGLDLSVATLTSAGALAGVTGVSGVSGTFDLTGATVTVTTQTFGDNTTNTASTAFVAAAVAPKAPTNSPTFTGSPQAPTPGTSDSSTAIATTAFSQAAIAAAAMSASTPTVPGDAGKLWRSTGTIGQWSSGLKASVMRFQDGTDATKQVAFDVSGVSSATTRTITVPDKNGTMVMTSDLILTKAFVSTAQTITSAGSLTIAHGLGAAPKFVFGFLTCVTGEANYIAGDVLCIALGAASDSLNNSHGVSVVIDATNLNVRYGSQTSTFMLLDKTTGVFANATNANWTFSLKAYV